MDKTIFYQNIRSSIFNGTLNQLQVDGIEVLLNYGITAALDLRWISYVLATTCWETAKTMQPIREYGLGAGHPYGVPDPDTGLVYYGRGFVQLTWKSNYQCMGDAIGIDLVDNPDAALSLDTATTIIYVGMINGMFTTKKLSDYFTDTNSDWYNARLIVNGLDHAANIQNFGISFYSALLQSQGDQIATASHLKRHDVTLSDHNYIKMEQDCILAST